MVGVILIDKNNNMQHILWDLNYVWEYGLGEPEEYPTTVIYDTDFDGLKYEKINGEVLFDKFAE